MSSAAMRSLTRYRQGSCLRCCLPDKCLLSNLLLTLSRGSLRACSCHSALLVALPPRLRFSHGGHVGASAHHGHLGSIVQGLEAGWLRRSSSLCAQRQEGGQNNRVGSAFSETRTRAAFCAATSRWSLYLGRDPATGPKTEPALLSERVKDGRRSAATEAPAAGGSSCRLSWRCTAMDGDPAGRGDAAIVIVELPFPEGDVAATAAAAADSASPSAMPASREALNRGLGRVST